jgi:hypothetical protein
LGSPGASRGESTFAATASDAMELIAEANHAAADAEPNRRTASRRLITPPLSRRTSRPGRQEHASILKTMRDDCAT